MRAAPCLIALLCGLPLNAAEPAPALDGAAFEAATTGRTLYYNRLGTPYGAEQYLPGRRVIWAFTGEDCQTGRWYEADGQICFVYENDPDPQCWQFWQEGARLLARFVGDPEGAPLIAAEESADPMACLGPKVGV